MVLGAHLKKFLFGALIQKMELMEIFRLEHFVDIFLQQLNPLLILLLEVLMIIHYLEVMIIFNGV
jgi:hypothetical protein